MPEYNLNDQLTIGTDASVVSVEKGNANIRRSSILLINTSSGGQVITIAVDTEAQANKGVVLNPGGTWSDARDGGYWPTQKQITAVSSAAGGLLSIRERGISGGD